MRRNPLILVSILLLGAIALIFTSRTKAQSSSAERRITQAVDEAKLVRLSGNTHPMARPEFDQGAAPPDLPMERMMLVLQRSPEQEAALDKLMAEQMDKSSPNYHQWITTQRFGQLFGPSDADIETVTSWLRSHGFEIGSVAKGKNVIDFSGNAGQVKETFHTEIHKYLIRGEEHWANSSDPQIPAALTPVVLGVNRLHNFFPKAMNRNLGIYARSKKTGKVQPVKPNFTYNQGSPCGISTSNDCFAVGPADFAAIYHVQELWNAPTNIDGTGQTIAIVNDSNINVVNGVPVDNANFRLLFGLPANNPTVILAGIDPGLNDDEIEAALDTQWAGAVAKGAKIDLVIAANTNVQSGVDIAAQFIVDNNVAPILSESFGNCESILGAGENSFINGLWQMAVASNGQTVLTSTGDQGAAGCENPDPNLITPQPATTGLAVSGLSTTQWNTAVGGTDFNQFQNQTAFWNTTPATSATGQTQLTAKGPIPENVWNDSCTNTVFISAGFDPSIQVACNDPTVSPSFIVPVGSGGGASGIYAKPTWQTGTGVRRRHARCPGRLAVCRGWPRGNFLCRLPAGSRYRQCRLQSKFPVPRLFRGRRNLRCQPGLCRHRGDDSASAQPARRTGPDQSHSLHASRERACGELQLEQSGRELHIQRHHDWNQLAAVCPGLFRRLRPDDHEPTNQAPCREQLPHHKRRDHSFLHFRHGSGAALHAGKTAQLDHSFCLACFRLALDHRRLRQRRRSEHHHPS